MTNQQLLDYIDEYQQSIEDELYFANKYARELVPSLRSKCQVLKNIKTFIENDNKTKRGNK